MKALKLGLRSLRLRLFGARRSLSSLAVQVLFVRGPSARCEARGVVATNPTTQPSPVVSLSGNGPEKPHSCCWEDAVYSTSWKG